MEDVTPTFCKDHLPTKEKDSYNFSIACEGIKPKGKYSCSNVNLKVKSVHKHKKEKSKNKLPLKKRHHSQKFDLKKIVEIHSHKSSKDSQNNGKHHNSNLNIKKTFDNNDISRLMKKHKFKLRNDFDRKHTEQFLNSKEIAFEMPFLLEINDNNKMNIILKNE
jgi:hypothetical protein